MIIKVYKYIYSSLMVKFLMCSTWLYFDQYIFLFCYSLIDTHCLILSSNNSKIFNLYNVNLLRVSPLFLSAVIKHTWVLLCKQNWGHIFKTTKKNLIKKTHKIGNECIIIVIQVQLKKNYFQKNKMAKNWLIAITSIYLHNCFCKTSLTRFLFINY